MRDTLRHPLSANGYLSSEEAVNLAGFFVNTPLKNRFAARKINIESSLIEAF
jgi:hypothetical protein